MMKSFSIALGEAVIVTADRLSACSSHFIVSGFLLLYLLPNSLLAEDWDVLEVRGQSRKIEFDTDEGTWMSVDICPSGRHVVFDLLGHIYRVPITGGDAQCLTCSANLSTNFHPKYSPDGQWIAFVSDRSGQQNLWMSRSDGRDARPVFLDEDSRIVEPEWMPDGSAIVASRRFKSEVGFIRVRTEIWRFPIDPNEAPERLVRNEGQQRQWPSVSRDGKFVYFHTFNNLGLSYHLQRLELKSGHVTDITGAKQVMTFFPEYSHPLGESAPEISPDGLWLAFARKIPGGRVRYGQAEMEDRTALWLKDLTSGKESVIMDPITSDAMESLFAHKTRVLPGYAWAPDGSYIVISVDGELKKLRIGDGQVDDIPFRVHVERELSEQVRYKGELERGDTFLAKALRWPRQHPKGSSLIFESAGQLYTWSMKKADAPRQIAPMPKYSQSMPAWSDDGTWLTFVAWNRENGGALWKVRADGSGLTRLTPEHGMYLFPSWSRNDSEVLASYRLPLGLDETNRVLTDGWEVVSVHSSGNRRLQTRRGAGPAATGRVNNRITYLKPAFDIGEYRRWIARGEQAPRPSATLISTDEQGKRERAHAEILGHLRKVELSPDGQWLAIEQYRDIYIAPVGSEPIDVLVDPKVRRISYRGGAYPHWLSSSKLEFFSANEYRVFDIENNTNMSLHVALPLSYPQAKGEVLLEGARVFVGDKSSTVLENASILIRNDRIACVGECAAASAAKRIDVHNKFVMPGWIDVHSHSANVNADELTEPKWSSSAAYLAYGVTTTSDPGTWDPISSLSLSEMHESGHILGSRRLVQGDFIKCFSTEGADDTPTIKTPDEARQVVERSMSWGVTLLKSYQQCSRVDRQMLLSAARDAGIGMTIEAQDLMLVLRSVIDGVTGWTAWLQYAPIYSDVAKMFGRANAHYDGMTVLAGYPNDSSMRYWIGRSDWWKDPKAARFTPVSIRSTRRGPHIEDAENYSWQVLAMGSAAIAQEGGYVPVSGHSEVPGIDTHWDVWALAWATGNARALRAASYDGAHYLGIERDLGTVEVGKIADLVVLNSDPLRDIHNTMDIKFVVLRGRIYDAETLDEVWPEHRKYGRYPWSSEDISRYPNESELSSPRVVN